MTPPPTHVSNKEIPNFVYALPENMAPQPSLTRFWCRGSITRLTTASKRAPNGTIESFIEVLRRPEGYGTRKNNFGVCSSCADAKEGACVEVWPVSFQYRSGVAPVLTRKARAVLSTCRQHA
jgi:hypothetical protein